MIGLDVLIRKQTADTEVAVGRVVEHLSLTSKLVDWGDGEPVEVKLGAAFVPSIAGSARYLLHVRPNQLQSLLRDDPVRLITLVLADSGKSMIGVKLLAELEALGIGPDERATAWSSARGVLERDVNVQVDRSRKPPKYKWVGAVHPFVEVDLPELSKPSPTAPKPESAKAPQADSPPPGIPTDEAPSTAEVATFLDLLVAEPGEEETSIELQTRMRALLGSNLNVAARLLLHLRLSDAPAELIENIGRSFLSTAIGLAEFPPRVIEQTRAIASGPMGEVLRDTLVAYGPASRVGFLKDPAFEAWRVSPRAGSVLQSMVDEVTRSGGGPRLLLEERLIDAARRILATPTDGAIPDSLLVDVLAAIAQQTSSAANELRLRVSELLLKRWWESADQRIPVGDDRMLGRLAKGCSPMAFTERGGRSAIVAAVFRADPTEAAESRWWVGLDFNAVADFGDGILGQVFANDAISKRHVRPLVESAITGASTRKNLMRVLGASRVVTDILDGALVAGRFSVVAKSDSQVSSWVDSLAQKPLVEQLELDLATAVADASRARTEAEAFQSRLAETKVALDRQSANLAAVGADTLGLRDQERRQIMIDSVRQLARLAALVEGESSKLNAEALVSRVKSVVSRSDLSPIGESGEVVTFDPARHDAPAGRPTTETPVTVVRSGYTWGLQGEDIVVVKALVAE